MKSKRLEELKNDRRTGKKTEEKNKRRKDKKHKNLKKSQKNRKNKKKTKKNMKNRNNSKNVKIQKPNRTQRKSEIKKPKFFRTKFFRYCVYFIERDRKRRLIKSFQEECNFKGKHYLSEKTSKHHHNFNQKIPMLNRIFNDCFGIF